MLIMRRHVMFIVFYISVNIYVFWTFIYLLKYNNQIDKKNTPTARLFKALYFLQGYFMPILRCLEPGFIEILRRNLTCQNQKEEKTVNQETSLAFLASKLNVELVNSILKGITRFALVDLDRAVQTGNYMKLTLKDANFLYNTKADTLTVNFQSIKLAKDQIVAAEKEQVYADFGLNSSLLRRVT